MKIISKENICQISPMIRETKYELREFYPSVQSCSEFIDDKR